MVTLIYIVIQIIQTGVLFLAIILHSLGIYLLSEIKKTRTNQNIILMHLSVMEMICSSCVIVYNCSLLGGLDITENFILPAYLFAEGTYVTFYLIMIVLTTDRLAMSLFLLRYQVIMTRTRIKIVLALCWVLGVISGGLFVILSSRWIGLSTHIFLQGYFLILSVATYISILRKIHKRRKLLRTNPNSHDSSHSQFYLVTCLIISSFILFVEIPDLYRLSINEFDIKSFKFSVLQLIWSVNNIADPCIYIFLQESARNLLKEMFRSWRNTKTAPKNRGHLEKRAA